MPPILNGAMMLAEALDTIRPYQLPTLYGHLVTAEPHYKDDPFMSDLAVAAGGNYTHQDLGSGTVGTDGDGGVLYGVTNNFVHNSLTTDGAANIVGVVVSDSTDPTSTSAHWWAYVPRTIGGVETPFTPNGTKLEIDLTTNGFWRYKNSQAPV